MNNRSGVLLCAVAVTLACGRSTPLVIRQPPLTIRDAGVRDASVVDAGLADAGLRDAGVNDAGLRDAGVNDAGLRDAGLPDAGVVDAGTPDAGLRDAGLPDAGVRDAGPDAGLVDAGAVDAGMPDAGQVDAGFCSAVIPTTPCAYSCEIDVTTGMHNCIAPVMAQRTLATPTTLELNLTNHTSVEVEFTVCNPTGWVFHLADSPTCNGYGGDGSTTNHDAEIQLLGQTLTVFGSDVAMPPSAVLGNVSAFAPPTGCVTRRVYVADSAVRSTVPCLDINSPWALRLNAPDETPALPNASWFVGLNGVYAGGRTGSGVTRARFCVR